ncbi:hypothetical protein DL764_001297 [Monosporascus ibericus]|uniref:Protein kinase domain-containing protein n=1 Tax=Monosporascus ibericus TaxID=155417 RepID=A0A4Q4TRR4_9PEZI|nr:hypothetical protein DL764_001297 [Monosporascus ibericus]
MSSRTEHLGLAPMAPSILLLRRRPADSSFAKFTTWMVKLQAIFAEFCMRLIFWGNWDIFEYAYRSSHTLFTFTELATRGDLFSMVCFYEKELPLRDIKFIVQQVLKAVRYLHKNKIAHRDVKPENIFFEIGPYAQGRVILGDLGFAKGITWGRMASKVGTKGYVAPEVCRGGSPYGLAVDMWSIGVLTLSLLMPVCVSTLNDSANQESLDDTLDQIFSQIRSTRGALSELLRDFISRCLVTDPDQRLTAQQARNHDWFHEQPDRDIIKERLKENEKAWRPTHLIAPPVEELPEPRLTAATPSSNARNDQIIESGGEAARVLKRKHDKVILISPGVQESPHFKKSTTTAATATPKKAKKTRYSLKHHLNGPPIQIAPTRTSSTGPLSRQS